MKSYEKFEIRDISQLKNPTVYYFLKSRGISENHIKNLRKDDTSIKINNHKATTRSPIKNGDLLEVSQNASTPTETFLCDGELDILYEDDDFLIVNKPHNLSCNPTRSHYSMNLGGQIVKYMQSRDKDFVLRIKNRLDRETAGIVVVAKNVFSCNNIELEKEYHALAKGNIYENITIDQPILTINKNGINEIKRIISTSGKRAITHVNVIKNYKGFCHIKLSLETGRTHQIRLHLSSIQHPLLGDTLYGEHQQNEPPHTMLILKKISFTHFRLGKKIEIEIPFPAEWEEWINEKQ